MMYVLILLTVIILSVGAIALLKSKKTTSGSIKGNIKEKENEKGIALHQKEDTNLKNSKKSIALHQKGKLEDNEYTLTEKEIKKINSFSVNPLLLFKKNFLKDNNIVNGDLKGKTNILSIYDFYFSFYKRLNVLFLEQVYVILKKDLFILHRTIKGMNLEKLKKNFIEINKRNGLDSPKVDTGTLLFKTLVVQAIGHSSYKMETEEFKKEFNEKIDIIKHVLEKKNRGASLTKKDKEVIEEYRRDSEIQKEININLNKKTIVSLLKFDVQNKEIHVRINYKDIGSRQLAGVVEFYKKKNNLEQIIFYV